LKLADLGHLPRGAGDRRRRVGPSRTDTRIAGILEILEIKNF